MTLVGDPDPTVPAAVRRLVGNAVVQLVWRNVLGGLTYRVSDGSVPDRFVKWAPVGAVDLDLAAEAERLRWAVEYINVPRVLDAGRDSEGAWLVTAAIDGRSAVDDPWRHQPQRAITAIGRGLRSLHDTLPVDRCPFSWSVEDRLAHVDHERTAVARITPPPASRIVVCHGDACAPNTLLDETGAFVGHVDFGSLGVADHWADIAVALWSVGYNWGDGWNDAFCAAYGIAPDPEAIEFYQRLWHLS